MIPNNVDYAKIGQRIRDLRLKKDMTQADLSALIGCSNNYLSHVETAQSKVSLGMLMRIAAALDESPDYFLLDTPFVRPAAIIDQNIAEKLEQCDPVTLVAVSDMIDIFLELQNRREDEL